MGNKSLTLISTRKAPRYSDKKLEFPNQRGFDCLPEGVDVADQLRVFLSFALYVRLALGLGDALSMVGI